MEEEGGGFPRRVALAFYTFLLVLGIFFYIGWSIIYNTWDIFRPENIGVYALTIILVGFGIVGILLYSKR
ncbi:MAG: hypothetical protein ACE5QW_08290 [Thermoplasmata archaeon]